MGRVDLNDVDIRGTAATVSAIISREGTEKLDLPLHRLTGVVGERRKCSSYRTLHVPHMAYFPSVPGRLPLH